MKNIEELTIIERFMKSKYEGKPIKELRLIKKAFEEERIINQEALGDIGEVFFILALGYKKEPKIKELANYLIEQHKKEILNIINNGY